MNIGMVSPSLSAASVTCSFCQQANKICPSLFSCGKQEYQATPGILKVWLPPQGTYKSYTDHKQDGSCNVNLSLFNNLLPFYLRCIGALPVYTSV